MESCKTCRWFRTTHGFWGQCRRFPPQIDQGETEYPIVNVVEDSCGEHEEAPSDPPAAAS